MSASTEVVAATNMLNAMDPATVQKWVAMVTMIPEVDSTGASMLEDIINATSIDAYGEGEGTADTEKLLGTELQIERVTRSKSDFADGLGVFLVVEAVKVKTGEPVRFTTGSFSVVAKLCNAYSQGWLPARFKLVRSERATRDGYYPQDLVYLGPAK